MQTTAFTTHYDQAPRRQSISSQESDPSYPFAVLLVLRESLPYSHFSRFSNAALLSFCIRRFQTAAILRQVDENGGLNFALAATTQTKFSNRLGCTYLEAIGLRVDTTDSCPLIRTRCTQ